VRVADRETPRATAIVDVPERGSVPQPRVRVPPGSDLSVLAHGPVRAIAAADVSLVAVDALPVRRHRARTADDGRCRLPRLPPGAYILQIEAPGFRPAHRRVTIELGRAEEIAVELEPQ
jgi:hypothetical protein